MSTPTNGRHVNLANTPFLWKGFFRATPMLTTGQRKAPYLRVLPLFHNRRLALLPFALFSGAARSGASWCPQFQNGRCHLGIELRPPFQKDPVPPRPTLLFRNGSYTSPLTHNRCSKMASFRATATIARFFAFLPPRPASF